MPKFDPGVIFEVKEVLASVDREVPSWLRMEILRTIAEEPGWSQRDVISDDGRIISSLIIYTRQRAKDGKIGRLPLSSLRFRISPEMAHNVFIRYEPIQIHQFTFHLGWNYDLALKFISEFYKGLLKGI